MSQRRSGIQQSVIVMANEHLSWPMTLVLGLQHVVAMFGATVLAPLLMGFDPNLAILMSGVGTLIFFVCVRGRIPSFLGSSFAFIGVVIAATKYPGSGPNLQMAAALGGIVVCGLIIAFFGLMVRIFGGGWIEKLMPPVVSGSVVAIIGLNLAPIAAKNAMGSSSFEALCAIMTILIISAVAVFSRGMVQRLLILIGLIGSYLCYFVMTNGFGFGKPIDFSALASASWLGLPHLIAPRFEIAAISLIAPVAVILIAENLGHLKAVSSMTGRDLRPDMGRAFMGDGIATMISGMVGGPGVTTYAENIGVMAISRVYSSIVFVVAGVFAIFLGFSPKFGALIESIPGPVMGGVSMVVFGLIAVAGARIWVQSQVDFSKNHNLVVAAITLILGAGDFTVHIGSFTLGGIGTATFAAIGLHAILRPKT
jgi:putative pyrimidine permease RutG